MRQTVQKNKAANPTGKGQERLDTILQTARQIVASEGYAGLSMRKVASQLGISLSNLQYYFPEKDLLIEAVLLDTMRQFQQKIDQISQGMQDQPRQQQLKTTIQMFLEELSDPVTYGLFFEIWAMAGRNQFASDLMDRMISREQKTIYKLIAGLNPAISDQQYHARAALIVAQVEGLMLFRLHRTPQQPDAASLYSALQQQILKLATEP